MKRSTKVSAGAIVAICAVIAVIGFAVLKSYVKSQKAAAVIDSIPQPTEYVVDLAGIIEEPSKTKLMGCLQELEQKTTAQFLILTVRTTGGTSIEEFALKVAEKWRLGQKDKDNGLLITVAVEDREYRIEVGRGLEGPLPDGFVGGIGRQYFVPYFRQGKFGEGLYQGSIAILSRLEKEYGVQLSGMPRAYTPSYSVTRRPRIGAGDVLVTAVMVIIAVIVIVLRARYGFYGTGWGSGYSGRGGGGWGGGGFGSFGGGGGGSFGGGGASGSW